jgi:hypothetical protein
MKRLWLFVSIVICAIAVSAAEAYTIAEVKERKGELNVLERNIRLDFKAVPLEKGDKGTYIITASSEYEISIRLEGEDGKIYFHVSGEVKPLKDERIFVLYTAHTILNDKNGEAEFIVSSGVILKPGQEIGVSKIGDKTLMIRASYVDE